MAPPRKSREAARLSGDLYKNPQRYRGRNEPNVTEPLGDAPEWLKPSAKAAWLELSDELPWLRRSHRALVEITATLRGRQADGDLGIQALQLLRQCLGQLGATPSTASHVSTPDEPDEDDPAAKYFT